MGNNIFNKITLLRLITILVIIVLEPVYLVNIIISRIVTEYQFNVKILFDIGQHATVVVSPFRQFMIFPLTFGNIHQTIYSHILQKFNKALRLCDTIKDHDRMTMYLELS